LADPIAVLVDREGLGDVMLKTPFLRALRRAFPEREVWWIATHQSSMDGELRPFFERDVARVITHAGLDGPAGAVWAHLKALPAFDRVFDARTKVSTVALARAALSHDGFYCCLPGYILCDGRKPSRRRPRHIAARMLSLVAAASGRAPDGSGRFEASAAARAIVARRLPPGPTYVGISPGSRQASKNWPIERFCEAARAFVADGLTPVFLLGPQEALAEAEIAAAAPGALAVRVEAQTPAGGLDLLIAYGDRLSLLLANDNGVGHWLGACAVPVVSLFGPTDPARWAPVAPANRSLRAQDFGGGEMTAIPTAAVADAVRAMLADVGPRQPPPAM
jgi:ADP-heptose:LPS heptosyltransferase